MNEESISQYLNRGFIWDYSCRKPVPLINIPFSECKNKFYELLDKNIKRIIEQKGKVLWTMSSGLDTSAILSHVKKYDLNPYTICFDNGRTDAEFSIKLSKEWKFKNHEIIKIRNDPDEIEMDLLEINSILPTPNAHSYLFFSYLLFKYTKKNDFDILVMGDGPDVGMLGTHDLHKNIILTSIGLRQYDIDGASKILKDSKYIENSYISKEKLIFDSLFYNVGTPRLYNDQFFYFIWTKNELKKKFKIDDFRIPNNELNYRIFIEWEQFLERTRKPTDLLLSKFNFKQSSPYLEDEMCNFILSLPPHYKYVFNSTKHLMREVYGKYLPEYIINKERTGFNPNNIWVNQYKEVIDYLLDKYVSKNYRKIHNFLDINYLTSVGEYTFTKKWSLINLSMWLEQRI